MWVGNKQEICKYGRNKCSQGHFEGKHVDRVMEEKDRGRGTLIL